MHSQYYIQYHYNELLKAVQHRQFKDVPFKLRKLGVEPGNAFKSAEMTADFDKHKTGMMRGILWILKRQADYGLTGKDFVDMVNGARKIGINWPELDIIEKSAAAMPSDISLWDEPDEVNESAKMSNDQFDANRQYDKMLIDLEEQLYDDITQWLYLLGHKVKPTNLAPSSYFDKYKTTMLKQLLHCIKSGHYYTPKDLQYILRGARNIGLTWPELDTIEKSVGKIENTAIDEARKELTNADAVKEINKLFGNGDDRLAWVHKALQRLVLLYSTLCDANKTDVADIKTAIDSYKHQIIKDMLHNMKGDGPKIDIPRMIHTLRNFGIDWPELLVFDRSVGKKIDETMRVDRTPGLREKKLEKLEQIFNDPNTDVFDRVIELYIAFGIFKQITQDDVDKILAKYKLVIVKDMLHHLRYGVVDVNVDGTVETLRFMGANWPELDVIEKSLGKAKTTLDEARAPDEIIHYEFDYDILAGISALRIYERNIADYPDYERIVNNRKGEIIRKLLQLMKDGNNGMAIFYVDDLHSIGVNWPELDVIYKSAKTELDKFFTGVNDPDQLDESVNSHFYIKLIGERLKDAYFNDLPLLLCDISSNNATNCPNMSQAFNQHKTAIMRVILQAVKNPEDFDSDNDDIKNHLTNGARLLGVDWPELAIIDKSTGHTSLKESTSNDASANYNLGGVLSSIESDEPREMVLFLCNLHYVAHMPKVAFVLQPHVKFIVKALLEFLKHEPEDAAPVETVRDCLEVLSRMRVTSPELNIIQRSLDVKSKGPDRE